MFPTTVWTRIHQAAAWDQAALQEFAQRYRPAVLEFIESRGFHTDNADDLCQDVFLRILRGGVLAKADSTRGRFRSLLLAVTTHVIQDHLRKRKEVSVQDLEPPARQRDFDNAWALHLTQRALDRLRDEDSPYYKVLADHLVGEKQDRNKLWIARGKLAAMIRQEVALTCATRADFEEELAYLSRYLQPAKKQ
ncbi:MAG: hypothetical protein IH889_03240 [Planctomycetes bacterium]|nr:hypothetical protein [Planctomycetota bacterium]